MTYEWDGEKAKVNRRKHRISFNDDLRPEYDLSQLNGGVRGKYYRGATAGTNLVLIEHELADVFPDSESVNRALRMLVNTAAAAARATRRRPVAPNHHVTSPTGKHARISAKG